ncbi:CxxxxCH/CxxCH domain c-type cytochrome [Haliangium sp.]|uniref:CxxxxCH/CxxCH domain c-type cytochrome n=1 Tax=Haliangium sp. TaxID=2663208 RepID=UPI003D0DD28C
MSRFEPATDVLLRVGVLCVVLVTGCARERDPDRNRDRDRDLACPSWIDEIGPAFADRCSSCHGPAAPAGEYRLDDYLQALGPGSDERANAVAGDGDSLLLRYLDPDRADEVHAAFSDLHDSTRTWVVDCRLTYLRSRIHAGGLMNPDDDDFHGHLVRVLGWDFEPCAGCHGDDFAGGSAGVSCLGCHQDGPTGCDTCHGEVPASGAHRAHVLGRVSDGDGDGDGGMPSGWSGYECAMCHRVPEDYRDPGHIFTAAGELDDAPAEVEFDLLAGYGERAEPPSYDPATGTCSEVYCHGATLADPAAGDTAPTWDTGPDGGACGACHGLAPASHPDDAGARCRACHPLVVDASGALVDAELHIDGYVALGSGSDDCDGCHATPADLAGNTDPAVLEVGAHRSHIEATHGLRGPIPCSDCHAEPSDIIVPGHLDTPAPAEVFPAGVDSLAAAAGAAPRWERALGTCVEVYCHGGGPVFADDLAPGLARAPGWTAVGVGAAACGTCHGAPPLGDGAPPQGDGVHDADMDLTTCATCHPDTVDGFGNILIAGPPGGETSKHIDGVVDFQ